MLINCREISYFEYAGMDAKELSQFVSYILPILGDQNGQDQSLRYDKVVVIKDDDLANLKTRFVQFF